MLQNSWPSLSRSLVPSLALSWSSLCRISWRAWMLTCFFALFMPFAFLSTGLCLWLRVGAASSSLRAAPRAPCLRMWSHFYCVRSFMGLRHPVLRGSVRAHDFRGVSASVAFHRNWSVSAVLDAATWSSSSVFTSFYLHDLQHEFQGFRSMGPFVAAGSWFA